MEKALIEPLGVDNYATWSVKMKMLLIHKGLWTAVTGADAGTTPASTESLKALALIALCVADHHLQAVGACETAKEAWMLLETTYKSKSEARVLQLRRELIGLKKVGNEPLTMYFGRASALAADLTSAGHAVKDTEVAYALLAGLPAAYDTAVTVMQCSGQEIELSTLLPRLLPIEQRLKTDESDNAAYAASMRPYGNKQQGARSNSTCYKCLQAGHRVAHCTNPPSPQAKKCRQCGRWGHISASCRTPTSEQVAFAIGGGRTKSDWILDSGCTNHMTSERTKFKTYKPLSPPTYFTFANGQKAAAVGRGEVQLWTGTKTVTLRDVLHVPDVVVNLLSVKKVMDSGARVEFSRGSCKVYRDKMLVLTTAYENGLYYIRESRSMVLSAPSPLQKRASIIPLEEYDDGDEAMEQDAAPASPAPEDVQDAPSPTQDADNLERSNTEEGELRAQPRAREREDQSAVDVRYPSRERRAPSNWFEVSHHAHIAECSGSGEAWEVVELSQPVSYLAHQARVGVGGQSSEVCIMHKAGHLASRGSSITVDDHGSSV